LSGLKVVALDEQVSAWLSKSTLSPHQAQGFCRSAHSAVISRSRLPGQFPGDSASAAPSTKLLSESSFAAVGQKSTRRAICILAARLGHTSGNSPAILASCSGSGRACAFFSFFNFVGSCLAPAFTKSGPRPWASSYARFRLRLGQLAMLGSLFYIKLVFAPQLD